MVGVTVSSVRGSLCNAMASILWRRRMKLSTVVAARKRGGSFAIAGFGIGMGVVATGLVRPPGFDMRRYSGALLPALSVCFPARILPRNR